MAACIDMSGKRTTFERKIWNMPTTVKRFDGRLIPDDNARSHKPTSVNSLTPSTAELTVQEQDQSTSSESVDLTSTLPKPLANNLPRIYGTPLAPVDMRFGIVREEKHRLSLARASRKVMKEAVVNHAPKAEASICFVVKRPGCVLCHEQGRALSQLVSEFADNQVAAWAVIKEIDVDNEGLLTFYQKYFRFPFFRDQRLALYSALGDRRVGIVPNPIKIIKRYREIRKRLKQKNMEGNMLGKGEGMILGGIIIFDRRGNIRYAHQEQFSRELPVDKIRAALRLVVEEGHNRRNESACSSSEMRTR